MITEDKSTWPEPDRHFDIDIEDWPTWVKFQYWYAVIEDGKIQLWPAGVMLDVEPLEHEDVVSLGISFSYIKTED